MGELWHQSHCSLKHCISNQAKSAGRGLDEQALFSLWALILLSASPCPHSHLGLLREDVSGALKTTEEHLAILSPGALVPITISMIWDTSCFIYGLPFQQLDHFGEAEAVSTSFVAIQPVCPGCALLGHSASASSEAVEQRPQPANFSGLCILT